MKIKLKFRSNIILIIISIVLFAFATQLARSEYALRYISNDSKDSLDKWNTMLPLLDTEKAQGQLKINSVVEGAHCLIMDSSDELSVQYLNNTEAVYSQMKYSYFIQDISIKIADYSQCEVVVVIANIEHENINIIDLYSYIEYGGNFLLARVDDPATNFALLNRLIGVVNYSYRISQTELNFEKPLLLGSEKKSFSGFHVYNDAIQLEVDSSVEVLVYGEGKLPLVWKQTKYGGNIVVFNGNSLEDKENRGMLTGLISEVMPVVIYPVFNAKIFYIDDYPAPMSSEYNGTIRSEYNRNIAQFFKDIWWPDMIELAKNNNMVYSTVLIQDYNDQIEGPFIEVNEENMNNLIIFGREILKLGGEIGIHGLNHQPLQFDEELADYYGYNPWKRVEDIEQAVVEVLKYAQRAFPNYSFVTYVPPSNILSMEGRQALIDNWESLRVIASLYLPDPLNFSYVQEFVVAADGIVEMPRITSGYHYSEYNYWIQLNAITTYGFYSHFIHPDDLIADDRSEGKNWSDMKKEFDYQLEIIAKDFGWLRPLTSGNAAIEVAKTLNSTIHRSVTEKYLAVEANATTEEQYYIMKTDKNIGLTEGCTVTKIDMGTYLVHAHKNNFEIELL